MSPPQDFPQSISPNWYPGLEWLRAIFIAFVVSMHLNLAQELARSCEGSHSMTIFDLLLNQVFCVAVPGFLLIAVFLQANKNPEREAIREHLIGTVFLYAFWVGGWIVWTHGKPQPGILGLIKFFLKGGGWAFYFFVALLIAHVVSAVIRKLSNQMLWLGLATSMAVIIGAFLMMAMKSQSWTRIETYWWPICFLPVPFLGLLLARHWPSLRTNPRGYRQLLAFTVILSILSGVFEWSHAADAADLPLRPFLPEYLRLSPLLTAFAALLVALKSRSAPKWICFIARNALGIFCLHVFILRGLHREIATWVGPSAWSTVVTLVVVLVGGAFATEFVRKLFRERLV